MNPRQAARRALNRGLWVKPGHYYSPIPSQRDAQRPPLEPYGIDLRLPEQLALADALAPYAAELPTAPDPSWRWQPANNMFGQPDAGTLYGMLAHRKPSRVMEVGSGWSTAVMLDARDRLALGFDVTCVEPYAARLRSVLRELDDVRVIEQPVQELAPDVLTDLQAGDVLFIDSTHVVKTGSDVVALFLHALPRLAPGVIVHVHDIHWPFTYPKRWLDEGRAWNETYLLQALLIAPSFLRVLLWGSYLAQHGRPELARSGSIWLEKQ